jgi:hypothetical protein
LEVGGRGSEGRGSGSAEHRAQAGAGLAAGDEDEIAHDRRIALRLDRLNEERVNPSL